MFPAHCFMLFPVLQFMKRKRVMVIKIDMKALSSYECIITTFVANWLFEIHETVLPEYFGIQSLISFKAGTQFWLIDNFPLNTASRKICDGRFLRLASQRRGSHHQDVSSQKIMIADFRRSHLSQITFIADRRIADRIIADRIIEEFSDLVICALIMWCCDMRRRILAVGDFLSFFI